MNFLQRLNPFYLRKEVERLTVELTTAQHNYERVLSDSEILQQTYDDNPELIKNGGVEQYLSNEHFEGDYKPKYTKRELHAFRAVDDSLRKEIETLTTTAENLNELLEHRTTELKQVKADLEKTKKQLAYSKKVNEAWFNTVLGFGVYDNILLNKAFWGKQLELVELSQEDSDETNS